MCRTSFATLMTIHVSLITSLSFISCVPMAALRNFSTHNEVKFCENPAHHFAGTCREGYALIECNQELKVPAFCVAQYEMKAQRIDSPTPVIMRNGRGSCDLSNMSCNDDTEPRLDPTRYVPASVPGSTPWVRINRDEAQGRCKEIGLNLISNMQWQSMARSLESVGGNWINDQGTFRLPRGSTISAFNLRREWPASNNDENGCANLVDGDGNPMDPTCAGLSYLEGGDQRRALKLPSGETLWDVNGNVWEWVRGNPQEIIFDSNVVGHNLADFSDLTLFPYGSVARTMFGPKANISAEEGAGQFYTGPSSNPGTVGNAIFRSTHFASDLMGSGYNTRTVGGIYSGSMGTRSDYQKYAMGFRCVQE